MYTLQNHTYNVTNMRAEGSGWMIDSESNAPQNSTLPSIHSKDLEGWFQFFNSVWYSPSSIYQMGQPLHTLLLHQKDFFLQSWYPIRNWQNYIIY